MVILGGAATAPRRSFTGCIQRDGPDYCAVLPVLQQQCRSSLTQFVLPATEARDLSVAVYVHGLGLWRDLVKSLGVHPLPDLDQVAVGSLRQAVQHLDRIQPRAQRAVDRAHLQTDDVPTHSQHALGNRLKSPLGAPIASAPRASTPCWRPCRYPPGPGAAR